MSWSDIWKGIGDIEFGKETYMWKFYRLLLEGIELKGKRVLEIGCGTGVNSIMMARLGAKVTFLDRSPESIRIVKRLLERFEVDGETVVGDVFDYNISGGYDIVHSEGVIEHFKGKRRQEIVDIHGKVLRKGGRCIIIVPNRAGVFYRVGKRIAEGVGTWIYGGEYPYSKRELVYRMKRAGLKTERVMGGEFIFSLAWLFSFLWLRSSTIIKKSLSAGGNGVVFSANYNNFFADRWGRVLGAVAVKV